MAENPLALVIGLIATTVMGIVGAWEYFTVTNDINQIVTNSTEASTISSIEQPLGDTFSFLVDPRIDATIIIVIFVVAFVVWLVGQRGGGGGGEFV